MLRPTVSGSHCSGLPDEITPPGIPIDADSITRSLRETFSPQTPPVPAGWPEDPVPAAAAQVVHGDGHLVLPRLIRYIEERRANERRFTGAIETDPSPLHIVWGLDDPIAVPSMVDTLLAARPDATAVRLEGVGHYPMVEAPQRFLDGCCTGLVWKALRSGRRERVHREFPGASLNLAPCRDGLDPPTATSS